MEGLNFAGYDELHSFIFLKKIIFVHVGNHFEFEYRWYDMSVGFGLFCLLFSHSLIYVSSCVGARNMLTGATSVENTVLVLPRAH